MDEALLMLEDVTNSPAAAVQDDVAGVESFENPQSPLIPERNGTV